MVWQALGGFGLNFLGNYANQMLSYNANKKLQENQAKLNYQYAEKSARNTPIWNRAGLESAGYNPMLAVQNATSGANSSWTGSAHADSLDTHAGTDFIANAQSLQRLDNETKTTESTVKTNEATARNQNAQAANEEAQNPYIGKKAEKELGLMDAETTKLNKEADNIEARLKLDQYLGELGIQSNLAGVKYSANKAYNASTYATNENNKTQRNIKHFNTGFGTGYSGYVDPDTFSSKERPTSRYNNTGKSYHWEHY